MDLEIRPEAATPGVLAEHARISIAFTVDRILEVTLVHGGLGGIDRFAYPGLPDEVQMLWWKEVPVPGR